MKEGEEGGLCGAGGEVDGWAEGAKGNSFKVSKEVPSFFSETGQERFVDARSKLGRWYFS